MRLCSVSKAATAHFHTCMLLPEQKPPLFGLIFKKTAGFMELELSNKTIPGQLQK
jgi:hypothetical protein